MYIAVSDLSIYIYMCVLYVCLFVCMFVCLYVRMYVCLYVCLYVCHMCLQARLNRSQDCIVYVYM